MASGQPPEIVETEKWYIDDSELMFGNKSALNGGTTLSPIEPRLAMQSAKCSLAERE